MAPFYVSNRALDLPQHLSAAGADGRPDGGHPAWGIEIGNIPEILRPKLLAGLLSAAGHERIGCAGGCGPAERLPDGILIIRLNPGSCKAVENVLLMLLPVVPGQQGADHDDLIRQGYLCRKVICLRQHLRDSFCILLRQAPRFKDDRIGPCPRIGNVKHIAQERRISLGVQQGNPLGAAPHIPAHGSVPQGIRRAGGGIRALGVDQQLIIIRVFVQPPNRVQISGQLLVVPGDFLHGFRCQLRIN